jgi:hypothetical protein
MSVEAPMSTLNDTYHFGPATFKTEIWINNKTVFKKPKSVNVEFVTAGAFDWVFADSSGHEVKIARYKNEHGGWTGIDFASQGLYQDYSIGFRNASGNDEEIKQGDVELR